MELDIRWLGLPDVRNINDIDLKQALQALEIKLSLEADEAALRASPIGSELSNLQDQNYIVTENGKITMTAELINSKLTVRSCP